MEITSHGAEERMAAWANSVRILPIEALIADCNTYHKEFYTVWNPIISHLNEMTGFKELHWRHMETMKVLMDKAEANSAASSSLNSEKSFVNGIRVGLGRGMIYGGIAASAGWFIVKLFLSHQY